MEYELKSLADAEVFDLVDEMVYIADAKTSEVLFANCVTREMTGIGNSGAERLSCYELMHGFQAPCAQCKAADLAVGEVREMRGYNDVAKCHVYIKVRAILLDGRKCYLVVSIDVTKIEQEKRDLHNALEAQDMLGQTLHILSEIADLDQAYEFILQNLGETLGAERAYTFAKRKGLFYNTHEWCAAGIAPQIEYLQGIDPSLVERWLPLFDQNRCVLIPDIEVLRETHPEEYRIMGEQGVRSYIVAPIRVRGRLVGFIGLDNPPFEKAKNVEPLLLSIAYYVSTRILMQEHTALLETMSFHDAMTNCGNRNAFMRDKDRLENSRNGHSVGVAYFDLNKLKETNDTLGHEYGDKMIAQAGALLHSVFPAKDIYRVGGDEFVVLSVDRPEAELDAQVECIKATLQDDDLLSISIGLAWEDHPQSVQDVIDRADKVMYGEKERYHMEKAAREGK